MMIKKAIKVNSIKYLLISCLFFCVHSGSGQCIINNELNEYSLNSVYTLDSLTVQDEFIPVLDHAIALLDSFDIKKDSAWLFYIIAFNSVLSEDYGFDFRIALRQGEKESILAYELPAFEDYLSGGLCYKGFTFLVLLNPRNELFFRKMFHTQNIKREFSIFYKSPIRSRLGNEYNYDILKDILLYYNYNHSNYQYIQTVYFD